LKITSENIQMAAQKFQAGMHTNRLSLDFLTPMRLVYRLGEEETLLKTPAFDVFFRRLLERLDELARQFAGSDHRQRIEIEQIYALSDCVRLVETSTHWIDLFSWSGRKGARTPMGGFTGKASYYSSTWVELLPLLLLGQSAQAGKLTVKGNGVFQLDLPGQSPYWQWLFSAKGGK
jgi:hypothetical protein